MTRLAAAHGAQVGEQVGKQVPDASVEATVASAATAPMPDRPAPTPGAKALFLIALVVVLYGAAWAKPVVVPLLLSVLVALTLAPAVRLLSNWYIPRTLAALLVVVTAIAGMVSTGALLLEPATEWAERTPQALRRLELRLSEIRKPIEAASEATEKLLNGGKTASPEAPSAVSAGASRAVSTLVEQTPAMITSIVATIFLVFLLLAHGDRMLRKCVELTPRLSAKKDLVAGTREAQHELSRYLLTVTLINLGLGAATALALYLVGIEDALLWGGVAALLNYAPYVGSFVTAAILVVVGFAEHSTLAEAMIAPGLFIGLNLIEGQVVTPLLVGRRLELDPILIVISLLVLGWLWGVAGVLLAVPLLAATRVIALRMDRSGRWGLWLGGIRD